MADHLRRPDSCPIELEGLIEGITKEQEKKLRSRKNLKASEEDRWRQMHQIVFPDDPEELMPSPCKYNFTKTAKPANGTSDYAEEYSAVSPLHEYGRYMARELPRLVRRRLESVIMQCSEPLLSEIRGQLVEIVRESQAQLFRTFQSPATAVEQSVPVGDRTQMDLVDFSTAFEEDPFAAGRPWDFSAYYPPPSVDESQQTLPDLQFGYNAGGRAVFGDHSHSSDSGYATRQLELSAESGTLDQECPKDLGALGASSNSEY